MTKFEKINKIKKLRELLEKELVKEVKDHEMIRKLSNSIQAVGLTLTAWDFVK